MPIEVKSTVRVSGGLLVKFSHASSAVGLPMTASVFLPSGGDAAISTLEEAKAEGIRYPVLMWLSGLTCTDDNVCQKGGVFPALQAHKLALACPDTSPRGAGAPGEEDSWDFGTGAGFYVDATTEGYAMNYRMYTYVTQELPALLQAEFPLDVTRMGVSGHSMGGHGALVCALRNPGTFRSVSAFAPIAHPCACPWGVKAFTGYLGGVEAGEEYDASLLLAKAPTADDSAASAAAAAGFDDILVDVGTADCFLEEQLQVQSLEQGAERGARKLTLRRQPGYDHSYYFVSTFLPEHVAFHAKRL